MRVIQSAVIYRALRAINAWYAIVVLWMFVLAFFVALPMMFVFPQVSLLLLFMSMAGLLPLILLGKVLRSCEYLLARRALGKGVCPQCGERGQPLPDGFELWRCPSCGGAFLSTGAQAANQEELAAQDRR